MLISSGKSIFAKKKPAEKLKKLDFLYEAYEPIAEQYNKLVHEARVKEKLLAEIKKSGIDAYDDPVHYTNTIEGLAKQLSELQGKINNSELSSSYQEAAEKIIALETEVFGQAKLPTINELDSLYVERAERVENSHQLEEKKTTLQTQIATYKQFESSYDANDFKMAMDQLNKELATIQDEINVAEFSLELHDVEIKALEIDTYGEAKLPHINKLASLYAIHNADTAKLNQLAEDKKTMEQEMEKAKKSVSPLDDETDYAITLRDFEEKIETTQSAIRDTDRSLHKIDERIIKLERELYGNAKLISAPMYLQGPA
jgi:hypothetical protein